MSSQKFETVGFNLGAEDVTPVVGVGLTIDYIIDWTRNKGYHDRTCLSCLSEVHPNERNQAEPPSVPRKSKNKAWPEFNQDTYCSNYRGSAQSLEANMARAA